MFVKYVGPIGDGVTIVDRVGGFEIEVPFGGTVEVRDELGSVLLEQATNWAPGYASAPVNPDDESAESGE